MSSDWHSERQETLIQEEISESKEISLGEHSHFPATDPPTSQDEFNEGDQSAKLRDCNDLPWGPKSPSADPQVSIFPERGHSSLNAPLREVSCLSP